MANIKNKLEEWCSHQIISKEQIQAILDYESQLSSSGATNADNQVGFQSVVDAGGITTSTSSWVQKGYTLLGIVAIGIGLISIVASNWQRITAEVKIGVDLLLVLVNAYLVFRWTQAKKQSLAEYGIVSLMILCLASIGLISQVYHTGGALYQALVLWSVMTFGLWTLSKGLFASFFWINLSIFASISWLFSANFFAVGQWSERLVVSVTAIPAGLGVGYFLTYFAFKSTVQHRALSLHFLIGSLIFNFFWAFIDSKGVVNLTSFIYLLLGISLALFALCVALMNELSRVQRVFLQGAVALSALQALTVVFAWDFDFVKATISCLFLACLGLFFASQQKQTLFHLMLVLLGLRLLFVYFQVFGGLMQTGVALVSVGILFIGAVVLWRKKGHKFSVWIQEKLQ